MKIDFRPQARLWATDCTTWIVPSASEAGVQHLVVIAKAGNAELEAICSCKGFSVRKTCRHIQAVFTWKDKQNEA